MDSDYIKREKFRVAITTKLMQLSKQCDEICNSSPTSPPKKTAPDFQPIIEEQKNSNMSFDFKAKIPCVDTYLKEKSDINEFACVPILPLLVNNFVCPRAKESSRSTLKNATVSPNEQKTYSGPLLNGPSVPLDPSQIDLCVDESSNQCASRTTELSPESEISRSGCNSRLFQSTPSTDLEKYMDSTADTFKSVSPAFSDNTLICEESPESQVIKSPNEFNLGALSIENLVWHAYSCNQSQNNTESQVNEEAKSESHSPSSCSSAYTLGSDDSPESQADRITVVSLTSDTNSATSEHGGEVLIERAKATIEKEEITTTPDSKTPRRRRLSYTLECPSPVLSKALEDRQVGPPDDSLSTNQDKDSIADNLSVRFLDAELRFEPKTVPNSHSISVEGKKPSSPSKSKIPVITSQAYKPLSLNLLQTSDQQFSNLEMKNHELKQYLGKLPVRPTSRVSLKYPVKGNSVTDPTSSTSRGSSPQLTSLDEKLQSELKALRQETVQQRYLLELQEQMLQTLAERQEQFFKQMQDSQQRLVEGLCTDLHHQLQGLFSQQRLEVKKDILCLRDTFKIRVQESPHESSAGFFIPPSEVVDSPIHAEPTVSDFWTTSNLLTLSNLSLSSQMKTKFDRLSAAVKGYLTRRLLKTEKVQGLIKTIQDTVECALRIHEVAKRSREITKDDADLHQRLINQVNSACFEFHDIFFKYPVEQQMFLISQSRQLAKEKASKVLESNPLVTRPYLSAATKKSLERKKIVKCKSVSPAPNARKKPKERRRCSTASGYGSGTWRSSRAAATQTNKKCSLRTSPLINRDQKPKWDGAKGRLLSSCNLSVSGASSDKVIRKEFNEFQMLPYDQLPVY